MMEGLTGAPAVGTKMADPMVTGKIALLDADYLKYVVTHRVYKASEGKNEFPDVTPFIETAIKEMFQLIGDTMIFCFSGPSANTFRYLIGFEKEYKGSRKNQKDYTPYDRKYEDMAAVISYCREKYVTLLFDDLEADDIVSALQCEDTYIVSRDKDLLQVPGWHFNGADQIYKIDDRLAMQNLCIQMIVGDSTDDIPGLPGVGERSEAVARIPTLAPKDMLRYVLVQYQKKLGLWKGTELFSEQYMLIKTRNGRGKYFREKYREMYDVLRSVKEYQLKKIHS